MTIFPVLIGLFIGIVLFIYFISKFHEHEDKEKSIDKIVEEETKDSDRKEEQFQKERYCPICSSSLKSEDSLYAEMHEIGDLKKVFIHGCKYCYSPSGIKSTIESQSEYSKQSKLPAEHAKKN